MTRQTNYVSGNVKKSGFLRNSTQTDWVYICSKNPCFSIACFSKAFRKFSVCRMTMFNIFENLCNKIISLCSKKITIIQNDINKKPLRFGKNCSFAVYFNFKVLEIFLKGQKCHFSIPKNFLTS